MQEEWEEIPLFTCEIRGINFQKGGYNLSTGNIETKVENLLKNIIEDLGYELYDVLYVKEGKDFYLRVDRKSVV